MTSSVVRNFKLDSYSLSESHLMLSQNNIHIIIVITMILDNTIFSPLQEKKMIASLTSCFHRGLRRIARLAANHNDVIMGR